MEQETFDSGFGSDLGPDSDYDSEAAGWRELLNGKEELDSEQIERLLIATETVLAASGAWGSDPTFVGPYRLGEKLGNGGFGDVYKAVHRDSQRLVALKLLRRGLSRDERARERFKREAKIASGLNCDHVVAIYDMMLDPKLGQLFIAMELIEGGTLEDKIRREKILNLHEAVRIVLEASMGLAELHKSGLTHRDVKPSNVLIDRAKGRAKLGDFGLACGPDDTKVTKSGDTPGTPAYMSPEQAKGETTSPASDVFSMGVILYEALSGIAPFRGEGPKVSLARTVHEEPPRLRKFDSKIPRDLETIVHKCLEKNPQRRYSSGAELAADLENWREHRPILARPAPLWKRAWKTARRRPAFYSSLIIVAIVILAYTAELWRHGRQLAAKDQELVDRQDELREKTSQLQTALKNAETAEAQAVELRNQGRQLLHQTYFGQAKSLLREGRVSEAENAVLSVPEWDRDWSWFRLAAEVKLAPHAVRTLGVHEGKVFDIKLSSDQRRVYSSGEDGRVIERDASTGAERELQAGVWSKNVRCWVPATAVLKRDDPRFAALDCWHALCLFDGDRLLAGASLKGKGAVWSLNTRAVEIAVNHSAPLTAVAASRDGRNLLFGGADGAVIRYDRVAKASSTKTLGGGETMAIRSLDDGHWLVGTREGGVRLLDSEAREVRAFPIEGKLWDIDLAPDRRVLAVAREGRRGVLEYELIPKGLSFELGAPVAYELPDDNDQSPKEAQIVRFDPKGQVLWASDDRCRLIFWRRGIAQASYAGRQFGGFVPQHLKPDELPRSHQRMIGAIALAANGRDAYLGGQQSLVTRWTLDRADAFTRFQVGANPILRPIAYVADRFWVADAQGALEVWNARSRACEASMPSAHRGRITALDASSRTAIAASAGEDLAIRFWMRDDQGKVGPAPSRSEIKLKRPLRSLSISPDGDRVAVFDDANEIRLWSVADGRLIRQTSFPVPDTARRESALGQIAFNNDGRLLAACGPGQEFLLFSGETLELRETLPYVVSGGGATALAWVPGSVNRGLISDTTGRTAAFLFSQVSAIRSSSPILEEGARDLVFAPDGQTAARALGKGEAVVFSSKDALIQWDLRSGGTRATGVRFDASGRLLALAHENGAIAVWDVPSPTYAVKPETAPSHLLLSGEEANLSRIRDEAFALDSRDRVCLVYSQNHGPNQPLSVWAGREQERGQGFVREKIGEMTPNGPSSSSLTARIQGDELLAVHRRSTPDGGGRVVLTRLHLESLGHSSARANGRTEEIVTKEAGNYGFYSDFQNSESGKPSILHFSFDGYYQHRAAWDGRDWGQEILGRQGDGIFAHRATGPDGETHVVSRSNRFNSDESPFVYFKLSDPERREIIDPHSRIGPRGIAVGPDGSIAVLYLRGIGSGPAELRVARRSRDGWVSSIVDYGPGATNLVWGRDGILRFAFSDSRSGRILLCEEVNGRWRTRSVWSDPDFARLATSADPPEYDPLIGLDSRDRAVVLVHRKAGRKSALFALRPDGG